MADEDILIGPAAPPHVKPVDVLSPAAWRADRRFMAVGVGLPALGALAAVLSVPARGLRPSDAVAFVVTYLLCGIGIGAGYHRLFAHAAFKAKPWLRAFLAIGGAMAVQGRVSYWVAHHRRHHQYSDSDGDPHTPHPRGFWHAHVGWIFSRERASAAYYARDMLRDPILRRVDRAYSLLLVATLLVPAAIGYAVARDLDGALGGLLWGGFARVFVTQQLSYAINSICHSFGTRPFATKDTSTNNALLMVPTLGEGLHNAHHAFPTSPRFSLRTWDLDVCWLFIRLMAALGQASDLRVPAPDVLARRTQGQGASP